MCEIGLCSQMGVFQIQSCTTFGRADVLFVHEVCLARFGLLSESASMRYGEPTAASRQRPGVLWFHISTQH